MLSRYPTNQGAQKRLQRLPKRLLGASRSGRSPGPDWRPTTLSGKSEISEGIPLLVQLQILNDLRAGISDTTIGRVYGITPRSVYSIKKKCGPIGTKWWRLPSGFELLVDRT